MTEYLFAYGTLALPGPDHPIPAARELYRGSEVVGEGSIQGLLYDIGAYPGAVDSANGEHRVYGRVFRLREPGVLLGILDEYEECHATSECAGVVDEPDTTSLFIRVQRPVRLVQSRVAHPDSDVRHIQLTAWVYLYNRSVETARLIPGGRYWPE